MSGAAAKPTRSFEQSGDLPRGVAYLSSKQEQPSRERPGDDVGASLLARSEPVKEAASATHRHVGRVHFEEDNGRHQRCGEDTGQGSEPMGIAIASAAHNRGNGQQGQSGQQCTEEPPEQQIDIVYMVECGFSACDHLSRLAHLRIVYLCSNRLSSLFPLAQLPHLELIDASDNSLQFMPSSGSPLFFRNLAVLYLHRNLFRRATSLGGLAQCKHLRVLTLRQNPVALDEFYRPSVFSAVPCLLALDGLAKVPHDSFIMASASDGEEEIDPFLLALAKKGSRAACTSAPVQLTTVHSDPLQVHMAQYRQGRENLSQAEVEHDFKLSLLKARNPRVRGVEIMVGWALKRFLMRCRLASPYRPMPLSMNSTAKRFEESKQQALVSIHKMYARCNPAIAVQRCLRGHFGRIRFRKDRIQIMMPTLVLQRMLFRKWVQRETQKNGVLLSGAATDQALLGLPLAEDGAIFTTPHRQTDLYFLPIDVARIQGLLIFVNRFFPDGMAPTLELSNLVLHHAPSKGASTKHRLPYFRVLATREYRQRKLEQTLKICALRHGVDKTNPRSIITRRGMSSSCSEKKAVLQAHHALYTPSLTRPCKDTDRGAMRRQYLLALRFKSQHSRGIFIRLLVNVSKSIEPVKFLMQEVVSRMVAACAIQCAVRSWLQRRRLRPTLGSAVFAQRAVRLMQRWWRWKVLQLRMACLAQVRCALRLNGDTNILYCFGHTLRTRFEDDRIGLTIFREARYDFDFDEKDQVFVHGAMCQGDKASRDPHDPPHRPFLPHWIGLHENPWERSRAGSSAGAGATVGAGAVGAQAEVKCCTLHFPERSSGNASHLKAILQTDCQVAVEATNGGASWGGGEGWRLPAQAERKLLASRPVLRLTFSSGEEARRRMAVLLIRTFRARTRDPVRLWNAQTAAKHVHAMYIQAIFRGYLTRRWWRIVTDFLKRQLGTSFLEQRTGGGDLIDVSNSVTSSLDELAQRLKISRPAILRFCERHASLPAEYDRSGQGPGQRLFSPAPIPRVGARVDHVLEPAVRPPTAATKGFGGGLPGASMEGRNKKAFVSAMKREKEWNRDGRWLADMRDLKSKCERNQRELGRNRAQTAAHSRPDTINMRVFEILQPRPEKVRGHSESDLAKIRDRITRHKVDHAATVEMNEELRLDYIDGRRRERLKERHLAHIAHQMYSSPPLLGTPSPKPRSLDASAVLPKSTALGATVKLSGLATFQTGARTGARESELDHRPALRISRSPAGFDGFNVPPNLPTLMSRKVDKMSMKRAQSALQVEVQGLKAQAQSARRRLSCSAHRSAQDMAEFKKQEALKQKRRLQAMREMRQSIDDKLASPAPGARARCEPEHGSRPASSHVDLRRFVSLVHSDDGSIWRLPRQHSKAHMPCLPSVATLLHLYPMSEQDFRNQSTLGQRQDAPGAVAGAGADAAARTLQTDAWPHQAAPRAAPDAAGSGRQSEEGRQRMGEERPVSAIARDQLLQTSGVNLAINLRIAT